VPCRGGHIHYLAWGDRSRPGVVLVHGGAAHAHWWCHVAPLLAGEYRVIALDLSGHGDSSRRSPYSLDAWADEVVAVADHAGMDGRPVVVGHSMGGFVTIGTAARHGDAIAGAVVLDSPVTALDAEVEAAASGGLFSRLRLYATRAEALARFRTVPEQDHYLPYVMAHVAEHSVRQVEGGWTWKYDPGIFVPPRAESRELLRGVTARMALFRSQHGLVTPDIGADMYELLGRVAPVVEIPEAGHHLMLDQPLLLVTALRTLLADWHHSTPR
jgi:pimeloyl-ACP methyl ester carboxylesterase